MSLPFFVVVRSAFGDNSTFRFKTLQTTEEIIPAAGTQQCVTKAYGAAHRAKSLKRTSHAVCSPQKIKKYPGSKAGWYTHSLDNYCECFKILLAREVCVLRNTDYQAATLLFWSFGFLSLLKSCWISVSDLFLVSGRQLGRKIKGSNIKVIKGWNVYW